MGDSIDNIPGVPGVGEKTAAKLIGQFGSVERLYQNLHLVPGKLREVLATHRAQALLSRELATVSTRVPLSGDLESLRRQEPDWDKLRALWTELEFTSLLRQLPSAPAAAVAAEAAPVLAGPEALAAYLAKVPAGDAIAVEWAGDGGPPDPTPTALGLFHPAAGAATLVYGAAAPASDELPDFGGRPLIGHDAKHLVEWWLAAAARRRRSRTPPSSPICSIRRGPTTSWRKWRASCSARGRAWPRRAAARDGSGSCGRWPRGRSEKSGSSSSTRTSSGRSSPSSPTWSATASASTGSASTSSRASSSWRSSGRPGTSTRSRAASSTSARPSSSPPSCSRSSSCRRSGRPRPATRPTPTCSSSSPSATSCPPRSSSTGRSPSSSRPTPTRCPTLINARTGRIHPSFNQLVAVTGRLSSSNPNAQNIPIRTELGRRIRAAFVPEAGHRFLAADYSQIELRILAHVSGEESLVEAFRRGEDIHRRTAAEVFGVPLDHVTSQQRDVAKTTNFAVIYGVTAFGLSRGLDMTQKQAQEYLNQFFARHPKVKAYLERTVAEGRERGYVSTLLGRRRYLPELRSGNPNLRGFGERMATNAPIQGTAADLVKIAMVRVARELAARGLRSRMLLQVHDELLFEVAGGRAGRARGPRRRGDGVRARAVRAPQGRRQVRGRLGRDMRRFSTRAGVRRDHRGAGEAASAR